MRLLSIFGSQDSPKSEAQDLLHKHLHNTCLIAVSPHCTVSLCSPTAPSRPRESFRFRSRRFAPRHLRLCCIILPALIHLACVPVTQQHNSTPRVLHHRRDSLYWVFFLEYSFLPSPSLVLTSTSHNILIGATTSNACRVRSMSRVLEMSLSHVHTLAALILEQFN